MTSKVWEVMNDLEMVTSKIVSAREIIDTAAEAIQKHDYDKAETLAMAAYEFLGYYLDEFDSKFKLAWQETVKKQNNFDYTTPSENKSWYDFWESYYPEESQQYTEEELNAMCDKASSDEEKEKCREYNLREAEYYDKQAIDSEYIKAKIEANSPYNDGWTKEYYQKIVDDYEGKKSLSYQEAFAAGWSMTDDGIWMPPQKETVQTRWILPVQEAKDADTDETEYFVSFPQDLLEVANLKEGDTVHWIDNNDGSFTIRKSLKPLESDEC